MLNEWLPFRITPLVQIKFFQTAEQSVVHDVYTKELLILTVLFLYFHYTIINLTKQVRYLNFLIYFFKRRIRSARLVHRKRCSSNYPQDFLKAPWSIKYLRLREAFSSTESVRLRLTQWETLSNEKEWARYNTELIHMQISYWSVQLLGFIAQYRTHFSKFQLNFYPNFGSSLHIRSALKILFVFSFLSAAAAGFAVARTFFYRFSRIREHRPRIIPFGGNAAFGTDDRIVEFFDELLETMVTSGATIL